MNLTRRAEWIVVFAAFVLCNLLYAATQDVDHYNAAFGDGGPSYHEMAARALRGHPLQEAAPFVYRPALPLLVAALADQLDWVIRTGFTRLSLGFNLLSVVLLALLMQRHVPGAGARLAVLAAFMIAPHSPIRLAYYHPVGVDSAALAFVLAGLLGADWFQRRPAVGRAAVLAVVSAIGVTFHEIALVPALCLLVTRRPGQAGRGTWREHWAFLDESGAWLPLLGAIGVSLAVRAAVTAMPGENFGAVVQWPLMPEYVVAWLLVFGPWLILPILCAKRAVRFFRQRPVFLLHGVLLAVAGLLTAGDPERWLVFASPAVWLAVAFSLSQLALTPRWFIVAIVVVQALWLRLGVPLAAPSYQNLWSQTASGSMMAAYLAVFLAFAATAYGVVKWRGPLDNPAPEPAGEAAIGSISLSAYLRQLMARIPVGLLVAGGTVAVLLPVIWLAASRFYWTDFAHPGRGYIAYNLARIWTLPVLALAFWATGARMLQGRVRRLPAGESRDAPWVESAICGAAAWSIAIVMLAVLDIYSAWTVVPLLAVSVAVAVGDLATASRPRATGNVEPRSNPGWGLVPAVLKFLVVFNAAALLLTIALWGNPGPDNDVPGNYLPYYEAVLDANSNAPNGYWVHYFVSKGHGLAFLVNALSDVQGAALATFLLVVLGGAMIWRLAQAGGGLIGLAALCLYLQFYAEQGAYAKGHTIRNTLILFLILSFVQFLVSGTRATGLHLWSRNVVTSAIVLLSPLAAALLVPLFCLEAGLVAVVGDLPAAKRYLRHASWVLAVTAGALLYNFAEVGLLELHSMPSVAGQWVDLERLSRWMDPNMAFVDERLAFIQRSLSGAVAAAAVGIAPTQSFAVSLRTLLNQPSLTLLGGAALVAVVALVWSRRVPAGEAAVPVTRGPMVGVVYLAAILLWIAGMRMFGGGPGSSMGRFTDFATPLGIALSVLIMNIAWGRVAAGGPRRALAVAMGAVFATALVLGSSPVLAQAWAPSVDFLLGKTSYAAMYDANWQTATARRIAAELPAHERVELVNFLPGFTAIPATPFQRPDGNVYLKDYTGVIYGTADEATALYHAAGINHFLFDVSGRSPLVWSGFAPLFEPESIRTRLRIVRHIASVDGDFYLLTWGPNASGSDQLDGFLARWSALLASERQTGTYRAPYVNGAMALGLR